MGNNTAYMARGDQPSVHGSWFIILLSDLWPQLKHREISTTIDGSDLIGITNNEVLQKHCRLVSIHLALKHGSACFWERNWVGDPGIDWPHVLAKAK